jgi:phosphoglucosamine mutase
VPLFGTDGVRGIANRDLTPALAFDVGLAAAAILPPGARVVVGRDTRRSGAMLEAAATAGLMAGGVDCILLGVAPTPAVAALVPLLGAEAGLVISASHNPPEYNGLKLLDAEGRKWPPARERAVEEAMAAPAGPGRRLKPTEAIGQAEHRPEALEAYRQRLVTLFAGRVGRLRVVVDLGHGAAVSTAEAVLSRLGLAVTVIHGDADGRYINRRSGATHPEVVAEAVRELGADLGLAFDGDADRLVACDENGRILDGDAIMYALATGLLHEDALPGRRVVATVMSNLGLERALGRLGVTLERTPVGDRFVAERMAEIGAALGGEQSGHVILSRWAVTGDGLLTALALLAEAHRRGSPISALTEGFERYPQVLRNIRVPSGVEADRWREWPGVVEAVAMAEAALGEAGRVVVRPSGTEPLLRVMLEGQDTDAITMWADRLQAVFERALESATKRLGVRPKAPEPPWGG